MSQVINLKIAKVFPNKFDAETVMAKLVREETINAGGIDVKVKKTFYLPNAKKSETMVEGAELQLDMSFFKSEMVEKDIAVTDPETGEVSTKKVSLTYLRV
jgi:hypothetical protein